MNAILLMFHCESNAGYAIDSLLSTFIQMSLVLTPKKNIHLSFTNHNKPVRDNILEEFEHIIEFNPSSKDRLQHLYIEDYIRKHQIDVVFGFDLPVWQPCYKYFRKAGAKKIVSYWGAPMSSLNKGIKLKLKQIEVWLKPDKPDHYIFESLAMAKTAYEGRGIPKKNVSVVNLGVNVDKYKPYKGKTYYAHDTFNIPRDRKIIYYSGHMEQRKGIAVLIKAAKYLYEHHGRRDFHFLLLGNQDGQEQAFLKPLEREGARSHVTFAGYRNDVDAILPSCYIGAIASTGWDSFTMSSIEIAACGLPLVVSDLQGLAETVEEGESGRLFKPGDYKELSGHIATFLNDTAARDLMGKNARTRILSRFSKQKQVENLVITITNITGS